MRKCEKCDKTDFDVPDGCFEPGVYSPAVGDWVCADESEKLSVAHAWGLPETAPKDRTFIADFGYPWAVVATWSPAMEQFAAADLEASTYQGEYDLYFVTEWHSQSDLKGWMDLPQPFGFKRSARTTLAHPESPKHGYQPDPNSELSPDPGDE